MSTGAACRTPAASAEPAPAADRCGVVMRRDRPLRPPRDGWTAALAVAAVAWRPHAAAVTAACAALLASRPRGRPAAAALGAVAAAAAPAIAGRVARRPRPAPAAGELTILAANVLVGRADTGSLATLLEREAPDLVALSEAGPDFRDKLMPLVESLGYRAWVSTPPGTSDGAGVTLLASRRAGDLRVRSGPEMRWRHLEATGGLLGDRRFVAVHPEAPIGPVHTRRWRADLDVIGRWCHDPVAPIVAGDLNATLDHSRLRAALGGCRSAAAGTGRGLVGTFPASMPRWCGIQIDHVLVPTGALVTRFAVLDVPGSDHRAVLARVRLPRG
jgi:endonuclease/exonuclease/phosphatase (EEP) superfamily protein YafD